MPGRDHCLAYLIASDLGGIISSLEKADSRDVDDIIRLNKPSNLWGGSQYAYSATVPAGSRLIFLAGACPIDKDGETIGLGDIKAQTQRCIENLEIALAAESATLSDVAFTRVLVASAKQEDLIAAWETAHKAFAEHAVPSTLFGVTSLGYNDQLVEIEATAAVRFS